MGRHPDRSLALLTDLYELTMAYGYWKSGLAQHPAAFHLFFRRPPFGSGFTIAAGLAPAIEFLKNFTFSPGECQQISAAGTIRCTGAAGGARATFQPFSTTPSVYRFSLIFVKKLIAAPFKAPVRVTLRYNTTIDKRDQVDECLSSRSVVRCRKR